MYGPEPANPFRVLSLLQKASIAFYLARVRPRGYVSSADRLVATRTTPSGLAYTCVRFTRELHEYLGPVTLECRAFGLACWCWAFSPVAPRSKERKFSAAYGELGPSYTRTTVQSKNCLHDLGEGPAVLERILRYLAAHPREILAEGTRSLVGLNSLLERHGAVVCKLPLAASKKTYLLPFRLFGAVNSIARSSHQRKGP